MRYHVKQYDRGNFKSYDIKNIVFASESHGVHVTWWDSGVLDISWSGTNDKEVYGYEVVVLDCKTAVVDRIRTNATSVSLDNVKNQVYLICIRSIGFGKKGEIYKDRKRVYCFPQPKIESMSIDEVNRELNISWGKINGATGYKVFVSEKESYGYRCIKTVDSSTRNYTFSLTDNDISYVYVESLYDRGNIVCSSGGAYCWNIKTGLMDFMK